MSNSGFPCKCLFPKAHFFSVQTDLSIVGLQTERERPKKEANHFRLVCGRLNRQGNLLKKLALGSCRMRSILGSSVSNGGNF